MSPRQRNFLNASAPRRHIGARQIKHRVFLTPNKKTYLTDLSVESRRNSMGVKYRDLRGGYKSVFVPRRPVGTRQIKSRVFLTPNKKTYLTDLSVESRHNSMGVKYRDLPTVVHGTPPPIGGYKTDTYTKDVQRRECEDKKLTNGFLERVVKAGDNCLVLDGSKARTSKHLLRGGAGSVLIPNYSSAFVALSKFSDRHDNVCVVPKSLHDVVVTSPETFDVIYMDTCGFFTCNSDTDLKSSIERVFYRNMLNRGGVFGVTITSRTDGTVVDAKTLCDKWITTHSGLVNVFTHTYGQMTTMFYK
jgi:hypothetical protein